jgi:hypothetical protein
MIAGSETSRHDPNGRILLAGTCAVRPVTDVNAVWIASMTVIR